MTKQKTLIFDLDGTLVNSAPDLVDSLNVALAPLQLPKATTADIGFLAGQGAQTMLDNMLQAHNKNINDKQKEKLLEEFLHYYELHIADKTKFYPNCLTVLNELQKKFTLAICTNKPKHLTDLLLQKLGQTKLFSAITYGDSFDFKKPDPRHLLATIKLSNGDIKNTIMIGDSINDIKAAQQANIHSIAVSFGYSQTHVKTLGADIVINNFNELPNAVFSIFN